MSNNFFKRFRKSKEADTTTESPSHDAIDALPPTDDPSSSQASEPSVPADLARVASADVDVHIADEPEVDASNLEDAAKSTPEQQEAEQAAEKKGIFARFRKSNDTAESSSNPVPLAEEVKATPTEQDKPALQGFFARIKSGLSRTSSNFAEGLGNLFLGRKEIDEELLEDVETQLLVADVGIDATNTIIAKLTDAVARKELADADALFAKLKELLADMLSKVESPLELPETKPAVILVVGVNGVGKTTTIGKLSKRYQQQGKSVMLAAGDTFRAAAVEQLQVWGERNKIPVVAQHTGADSASVIYDAVASAQAKGVDVVIADTAGRLHNKNHLMDELAKVKRVMAKLDASAPHEVLLVLDAGTGQNATNQAQQFIEAANVTGLVLTKLDGTAKGGVIFALSEKFGLPVRFIGVGEGVDDLQPFVAEDFVQALFQSNT